ncbi:MAG: LamG-like jellyroll fold domain-containing protein [bacterium]
MKPFVASGSAALSFFLPLATALILVPGASSEPTSSSSHGPPVVEVGITPCSTCVEVPSGLVCWWPLDETVTPIAHEIARTRDGTFWEPTPVAGKVQGAFSFAGTGSAVQVENTPFLQFGALGNFSIDAWILTSDSLITRSIVEKIGAGPLTGRPRGYSFYVKQGRLALALNKDNALLLQEYWSGAAAPTVADGEWHHVAVTVVRGGNVTFYKDGIAIATVTPASTENCNTNWPLQIGSSSTLNYANRPGVFLGRIDEVEIFDRALLPADVALLADAQECGKCKAYCFLPWDFSICDTASFVDVPMQICNFSSLIRTYDLSFAGLPFGTHAGGGKCTVAGPTVFTVLNPIPPFAVNPGACQIVNVRIDRPADCVAGKVSCYELTAFSSNPPDTIRCIGSLECTDEPCVEGTLLYQSVQFGDSAQVEFRVFNPATQPVTIDYEIHAMSSSMDSSILIVSLDGEPPGVPILGALSVAPGETVFVSVLAEVLEYRPFTPQDILFMRDFEGTGDARAVASAQIRTVDSLPSAVSPVDESEPNPPLTSILAQPNPFAATVGFAFTLPSQDHVRARIVAVDGSVVRTLHDGRLGAGFQRLSWDGRDESGLQVVSGVYFVTVEAGDQTIRSRVVRIR